MDKKIELRSALTHLAQRPVAFYPVYARLAGGVKAGVMLSQIMYWWSACGGRKFYKTDHELMEETCLSRNELSSAKGALKTLDFVLVTREGTPARTHYDIDEGLFFYRVSQLVSLKPVDLNDGNQETSNLETSDPSITENTSDTTQIGGEATPPHLPPGEYNRRFFDQGVEWMAGGCKTVKGDQLIEIARWMVEEKKWSKGLARTQLEKFVEYWTTLDPTGKVPRWRDSKNKYFKLKGRVSTWMNNATK